MLMITATTNCDFLSVLTLATDLGQSTVRWDLVQML